MLRPAHPEEHHNAGCHPEWRSEMKQSIRNAVVFSSAAVLLAVLIPRASAVPGSGEEWQSYLSWPGSTLYRDDSNRIPDQYDPVLLSLGRSVYIDLQRARQAALDREATNLQVAIREAGETLHRLELPLESTPLQEQLEIIRNDLKDRSKDLGKDLWVPVEAEIDDVLVYVPDEIKARAHEAIRKAREAAAKNDRRHVSEQLDVVTSTLEYSLGVFPLSKVRSDLNSAQVSASLNPPDWTGALEALQSSLAAFHWYTQVPAHALLSAYNNVINAYVLATGPIVRDDQQVAMIGYLTRAQRELDTVPDGKSLVDEVRTLIDSEEPQGKDIKSLLGHIQERMRAEQHEAEIRYRESLGTGKSE
jgi:hypothetical protein